MGLFSAAKLFAMTIRESATDGSDFTNPDADYRRLFLGEDGGLHLKDSAGTVTDIASGAPTIATVDATLSGDVTMTDANTAYDGPSASFAAGTWLVVWKAVVQPSNTSNTHDVTARLWDGSTTYDEASNGRAPADTSTLGVEVSGCAIVTLGSPATLKITCYDVRAGSTIKRNVVNNGAGSNKATRLVGYKVT